MCSRVLAITNPRILVVAHERSEAKIIEKYVSLGEQAHFTNVVTELVLEESARLEHCKIQDESLNAFHVATIHAAMPRASPTPMIPAITTALIVASRA